jgi:hypothetical protein
MLEISVASIADRGERVAHMNEDAVAQRPVEVFAVEQEQLGADDDSPDAEQPECIDGAWVGIRVDTEAT